MNNSNNPKWGSHYPEYNMVSRMSGLSQKTGMQRDRKVVRQIHTNHKKQTKKQTACESDQILELTKTSNNYFKYAQRT